MTKDVDWKDIIYDNAFEIVKSVDLNRCQDEVMMQVSFFSRFFALLFFILFFINPLTAEGLYIVILSVMQN